MTAYHGTTVRGLEVLRPFASPHSNLDYPCVYLSADKALASIYIWKHPFKWMTFEIGEDGIPVYNESFKDGLRAFYGGVKGVIYTCSGSFGTDKNTGIRSAVVSPDPVPVAAADELDATGSKLQDVSTGMLEALSTGDLESLRKIIGSDPSALAEALSAPVSLDRHAVYPVSNFGSAMAPLYTTLALWIGALLIMVAIKANPSDEERRELGDLTPRQVFAGRFAVVAALSLLQSTSIGLGNLFFLGVQAVHPLLYMACLWGSGLVFAFIIYTLVASFANFGKALSVMLLIIQVSGGGGSYPLQLLPRFFQDASPFLPITHAVNAMRAAMFGVYQGDFWVEMGVLALFVVPFVLLGFVLRNPLISVVDRFVEKVESTRVM